MVIARAQLWLVAKTVLECERTSRWSLTPAEHCMLNKFQSVGLGEICFNTRSSEQKKNGDHDTKTTDRIL